MATTTIARPATAQNATWLAAPGSNDFNSAANWTPAAVPTGTAIFGVSNVTNPDVTAATAIDSWVFNPGASNYAFTINSVVAFAGAGIVVNGGSVNISNATAMLFTNASGAGRAIFANGGTLAFQDNATAARPSPTPVSSTSPGRAGPAARRSPAAAAAFFSFATARAPAAPPSPPTPVRA